MPDKHHSKDRKQIHIFRLVSSLSPRCNIPLNPIFSNDGNKKGKISPDAEVRLVTVPGNRKTCAVRSSLPGCVSSASLQSGLPFGGITDNFTATALDTFD